MHVPAGGLIGPAQQAQEGWRTHPKANGPYRGHALGSPLRRRLARDGGTPLARPSGSKLVSSPSPQRTRCGPQDRGARPEGSVVSPRYADRPSHNSIPAAGPHDVNAFSGWKPVVRGEGRPSRKEEPGEPSSAYTGYRRPLPKHSTVSLFCKDLGFQGWKFQRRPVPWSTPGWKLGCRG